jgi:sugar phosphate isomerase/epimerase
VEDISGRKHYHSIPGTGTMDWCAIGAALREIDYQRFATLELYTHTENPDEAARASYAFLSRTWGVS